MKFTTTALTKSHLSNKTIGCLMRFFLFVCGYGASARSGHRTTNSESHSEGIHITNDSYHDCPLLVNTSSQPENRKKIIDVFEEASLALKTLVTVIMTRVELAMSEEMHHEESQQKADTSPNQWIKSFVYNIIDEAADHVEVSDEDDNTSQFLKLTHTSFCSAQLSRTTQSAMAAISRHGGSSGGESFWKEVSERSKRALMMTRVLSMNPAKLQQTAK